MALILFGIFMVATIASHLAFDHLVKHQYESAREEWEHDGRPIGVFWKPPDSSGSSWARNIAMMRFLVKSPGWIQRDERAIALQRRLRGVWLCCLSAWLLLVVLIVAGGG